MKTTNQPSSESLLQGAYNEAVAAQHAQIRRDEPGIHNLRFKSHSHLIAFYGVLHAVHLMLMLALVLTPTHTNAHTGSYGSTCFQIKYLKTKTKRRRKMIARSKQRQRQESN